MYYLGVNGKPIRRTRSAKPFNFGPSQTVSNAPVTRIPDSFSLPKQREVCDKIAAKMTGRVTLEPFFRAYVARKGKFEERLRNRGVVNIRDVVKNNARRALRGKFRTTEEALGVLLAFPREKAQETQTPSKPEYVERWTTQKVLMLNGEEKELFRPSHYERV